VRDEAKRLAWQRAKYAADPAAVLARHKRNRDARLDHYRSVQAAWRAANPEKIRERNARRRRFGSRLPAEDLPLDAHCAYCLVGPAEELEHCTPLSRGGANDWTNVVMACRPCNRAKGTKTVLEFMCP
jgi:5-methylcytosine-specific restriction endonuclease McrA